MEGSNNEQDPKHGTSQQVLKLVQSTNEMKNVHIQEFDERSVGSSLRVWVRLAKTFFTSYEIFGRTKNSYLHSKDLPMSGGMVFSWRWMRE